jgi:hypothetical protein
MDMNSEGSVEYDTDGNTIADAIWHLWESGQHRPIQEDQMLQMLSRGQPGLQIGRTFLHDWLDRLESDHYIEQRHYGGTDREGGHVVVLDVSPEIQERFEGGRGRSSGSSFPGDKGYEEKQ